jgi:hypothetical protein
LISPFPAGATRKLRAVKVRLSSVGALLALLTLAAPAQADTTISLKAGPYRLAGFETIRPKEYVRTPPVDGFITRMHARLVDTNGRPVSIRHVMLHHVVFLNRGRFAGDRKPKCGARFGEPFYGTGEENQALDLPAGYGYRTRPEDLWKMQTMLMSHTPSAKRVWVKYTMTVTKRRLAAVTPYWVRTTNCRNEPSWSVPGGRPPGSVDLKTHLWRVPADGLLVAGGAHLHGGAYDMTLRQPSCRGRRLIGSNPSYGLPEDVMYNVQPILHEPGPMNTAWFSSRQGVAVHAGDRLRVTAAYDATRPHMGVMGVYHVYIAEGRGAARRASASARCGPLPEDRQEIETDAPHRDVPPPVTIPLTQLVGDTPTTLEHPRGRLRWFANPLARPVIEVDDMRFETVNLSVVSGTTITWRFDDVVAHKVQLANGPRAMGSPTLSGGGRYERTFTVPGVYQMFCYLHPMTMHQELTVRPGDAAGRAREAADADGIDDAY